jgi:DNA-binding Lrp family transcriptional regulator
MKEASSNANQALLIALQQGIPLARRPWAEMAGTLGMTEVEVLHAAQNLFTQGVARRFGGVFDSRHLGYASTLCAVDVPAHDIERIAELLQPHPGVTHCYEREGIPSLWFTLTAQANKLEDELQRVENTLKPYLLLNLPAIRRFKVEVVLDAAEGDVEPVSDKDAPGTTDVATPPIFSACEKSLVRKLQGNLSVVDEPFAVVAQDLKLDIEELLELLTSWKKSGILRRIGFILRHRKAGFVANGMCVWPVAEADVVRAGKILAAAPEVTHCYERHASPSVPFNLYAMIHAREKETAGNIFRRLGEQAALSNGRMLVSTREFKKTSPVFFLENEQSQ